MCTTPIDCYKHFLSCNLSLPKVLIRVIDTNNHRPEFSQPAYVVNIPEDKPVGTEVMQISAVDRDEKNKLTFTLLSSTDPFSLRKFRLDPGTGILYTAERLDHETIHRHILTVMVCVNKHELIMLFFFKMYVLFMLC